MVLVRHSGGNLLLKLGLGRDPVNLGAEVGEGGDKVILLAPEVDVVSLCKVEVERVNKVGYRLMISMMYSVVKVSFRIRFLRRESNSA